MSRTPRGPGLTKTEQLRQAKTSAFVRDLEKRRETTSRQPDPFARRKKVVMHEPKKVDFKKPGMTKAMMARVKHAEKFKQEYERKQESLMSDRRPQRTPAPIGDYSPDIYTKLFLIRMGRERTPHRTPKTPRTPSRPRTPAASPPRYTSKRDVAGPSHAVTPKRAPKTPKKTTELAKMMNADIVQAEPVGDGPIRNVVIPPGVIKDDRTTIISIPQPEAADVSLAAVQATNRSIQIISETLDEQEVAEAEIVQDRLTDLQQARRDFVMTVANVGGNVISMDDITPPQYAHRVPDLEDESLKVTFGRDHPDVIAAREHMQKHRAEREAREAMKRMEEEFQRVAAAEHLDDLQLDIPFEEEFYQDKDISWVEDEETGTMFPRPSRVKAYTEDIPATERPFEFEPFDPQILERFFDLKRYPPCPQCSPGGPPPGKETLHPDLWDLDDPWYQPPPEGPDLMEFDLIDFD
ncbi:uncharacterized protein LOC143183340 [Calliopsis andreniformis]|uniref:uncharacterized protein LOC143183340 n=1 Tax=Calliopsis andreniformis TaxID=337506 RepID=UPI003FCDB153